MLIKESSGFVSLPGGFGTQDETLELLTLVQTGKSAPAPLVLLDVPGQSYWVSWQKFVVDELVNRGLVSPHDTNLFTITDDVDEAVAEYEAIKALYREVRSSHDFDAAVIAKGADGKVRIVKKHEQPTRHGAVKGLGWGLAVGVTAASRPPAPVAPRSARWPGTRPAACPAATSRSSGTPSTRARPG
jgi:hypothetical protein